MLSFNCKTLLIENAPYLMKTVQNLIHKIDEENLYIETLANKSSSLNLSPEDYCYYQQELQVFLTSNKDLSIALKTFLLSLENIAKDNSIRIKF